jgi:hypothetical protein
VIPSSPLEGLACLLILLGLTAASWTALWLYERRQDREEQQQGESTR